MEVTPTVRVGKLRPWSWALNSQELSAPRVSSPAGVRTLGEKARQLTTSWAAVRLEVAES